MVTYVLQWITKEASKPILSSILPERPIFLVFCQSKLGLVKAYKMVASVGFETLLRKT